MNILTYNGQEIQQRLDGYVNATQMCKTNAKEISHWFATSDYSRYLDAYSQKHGKPRNSLVIKVSAGFPAKTAYWVHPDLAIKLGRWISVDFELWCDIHIKTLIETGSTSLKKTTYVDRLEQIDECLDRVFPECFCVVEECQALLRQIDAQYPVDRFDLLDGSIGIRWSKYRKEVLGLPPTKYFAYYHNNQMISRGYKFKQSIKAYHENEIPAFRSWLREEYIPKHMNKYLEKKYGMIVKV